MSSQLQARLEATTAQLRRSELIYIQCCRVYAAKSSSRAQMVGAATANCLVSNAQRPLLSLGFDSQQRTSQARPGQGTGQ